jgi:MFS family permease
VSGGGLSIVDSLSEKQAFHVRDTYKWWVLVAVSIGSIAVGLDNSILTTCLPRLATVFHTDSSVIAWVNLAYFVTSRSLMLTLGKMGDICTLRILGPVSGRLSDKIGFTFLSTLGVCLFSLSLFLLSRLGAHPTCLAIGLAIALSGIGMSIFQPPNNSAILGTVSRDKLGIASSIGMTARQIGFSSGIAVALALFSSRQTYLLERFSRMGIDLPTGKRMASINGFQDIVLVGCAIAGIGIFTSLVRGSRQKAESGA